jgi:hypothetical protein
VVSTFQGECGVNLLGESGGRTVYLVWTNTDFFLISMDQHRLKTTLVILPNCDKEARCRTTRQNLSGFLAVWGNCPPNTSWGVLSVG